MEAYVSPYIAHLRYADNDVITKESLSSSARSSFS